MLIHGAGDVAWYWHLVSAELLERGHDVVAVDLPCDDDSAGWSEYADTVVDAIGERTELAAEALKRGRDQAETPMLQPWPLDAWPDVPTKYLLCRDDRCFPADFLRRVVRERLGITPDEIDGGHTLALSRPKELADRLEAYRAEL